MIRYGMPGESVTEYCFIGGYWATCGGEVELSGVRTVSLHMFHLGLFWLVGVFALLWFGFGFSTMHHLLLFLARCCLGQVPGGAPFSQQSELATACTNRMQIRN